MHKAVFAKLIVRIATTSFMQSYIFQVVLTDIHHTCNVMIV